MRALRDDLGRRFGEDFRDIGASSAAAGLAMLRELQAGGQVYRLLDGPGEESIRKHHEARHVPCGDVHQVDSLL